MRPLHCPPWLQIFEYGPSIMDGLNYGTVQEYLDRGPFVGSELLEAMGEIFCLSGFMAQAYFSQDPSEYFQTQLKSSDWDFYTDGTIRSLEFTIENLQKLGVKFDSVFDDLNSKISARMITAHKGRMPPTGTGFVYLDLSLSHLRMMRDHWRRLERHCNLTDVDEFFTAIERQGIDLETSGPGGTAQEECYFLRLYEDKVVPVAVWTSDWRPPNLDGIYKKLNLTVITGKIGAVLVQVIAKPGQPVEQVISEFHSSNVQCFIGKTVALHLYYQLTRQRKSYFWKGNSQDPKSAAQAKKKYIRRGFEYVEYPSERLSECKNCGDVFGERSLEDDESLALIAEDFDQDKLPTTIPPLTLKWREDGGSTTLFNKRTVDTTMVTPGRTFWLHVNSRPYAQFIASERM
jgi:hypothetical protein